MQFVPSAEGSLRHTESPLRCIPAQVIKLASYLYKFTLYNLHQVPSSFFPYPQHLFSR